MTKIKNWLIGALGTAVLHLVTVVLFVCMIPLVIVAYVLEGVNITRDKLWKNK